MMELLEPFSDYSDAMGHIDVGVLYFNWSYSLNWSKVERSYAVRKRHIHL